MATRKKSAAKSGNLRPPAGGLAVRMYRHGLGDCFLLAFAKPRAARPCYVLIDCGVHGRQTEGTQRLGQVMQDVVAATGGTLDVVVATHEHADHLSGFVQKGSPFVGSAIKVNRFWVAWTEKDGDAQARRLRAKHAATRAAIAKAVKNLEQRRETARAKHLTGLLDFEHLPTIHLDTAFTKAKGSKADKAGVNEVALALLQKHAQKVEYCEPGETLRLPGVTGVRAYVLGPPRDEDLLKRDKPAEGSARETYLMGLSQQRAFALAPAFGDECPIEKATLELRHPFELAVRRETCFDGADSASPWSEDGRCPERAQRFFTRHYFRTDHAWRRIDTDWLGAAEQLALNLDNDTNNTSLVLAFEWGEVGRGPVLLFTGDAQVGNWLSWSTRTFKAGGRTVSAEDLLSRTILYKVGHHGSHNATVRRNPLRTSPQYPQGEPFGLELMPPRLIALIPVDHEAAGKRMPTPWHMPHPPLYQRLLEKAAGRVLRSDGRKPSSEGINMASHCPPGGPPGLANVTWREASVRFKNGLDCPLYYDLVFRP